MSGAEDPPVIILAGWEAEREYIRCRNWLRFKEEPVARAIYLAAGLKPPTDEELALMDKHFASISSESTSDGATPSPTDPT